ncbi:hypothetical protein SH203_02498 [Brevundimonas sp. SH203]|nr:hypothetical protein SH203_02498 [Brevundimonas sp. SH203]
MITLQELDTTDSCRVIEFQGAFYQINRSGTILEG